VSPTTTRERPASSGPPPEGKVDPRISARRSEVSRQQGRRRVRMVAAVAVAALLAFGAWSLLHSFLFSARAVTVVGAAHETTAQIEAAAGLSGHPPLLDVNAAAAERGLDNLPWVKASLVTVHWPDGVRVQVVEQVPTLVMPLAGGQWAELAANGRVLAVTAARPAGLMEVTGPTLPGKPGATLGGSDRLALGVAATLPPSFRAQVTAVKVVPAPSGAWVQLTMTTPILIDIGNTTQLTAKYEDVTTMLANVPLHDGDTIDVSVPGAPTVTGP
jgi:cell division septal protein FtsQ